MDETFTTETLESLSNGRRAYAEFPREAVDPNVPSGFQRSRKHICANVSLDFVTDLCSSRDLGHGEPTSYRMCPLVRRDFGTTAEELLCSVEDGTLLMVLNRPAKKNAFTLAMLAHWADILADAAMDSDVRAVVVTGSGDAFCSGADLGADEDLAPIARKRRLMEDVHPIPISLAGFEKPVIAAVNGVAVGAGMDLALMADIRLAARSARFCEGYIRVGIPPGDGGAYFLPRVVGEAAALELLLSGDFIDADEAERIGLVNRTYPDDKLLDAAMALAQRMSSRPPEVVSTIKRTVAETLESDLVGSLDLIALNLASLH
jgi:enoyl-CoA hydratase/carnithine racemase